MADPGSALDQYGPNQHSIVTRQQLVDAGASDEWIEQQVATGWLIREAPSVYRPRGVYRSWKLRAEAAILSARAPALVSHRSAAYLWGLTRDLPGFIDITVPRHRPPRKRAGIKFHESLAFDLARPAVRDLIPVTGVARTILDCCATFAKEIDCLHLLDEARRLKLVEWDELWQCLFLHAGRGRRGIARYRNLLLTRHSEAPPDSVFVRLTAELLADAGLPPPVFDHPIFGGEYRLDMAWLDRMATVECYGDIAHGHEAARERDPVRRNRIRLAGWLLIEVTWNRLVRDPAGLVEEVRSALQPPPPA